MHEIALIIASGAIILSLTRISLILLNQLTQKSPRGSVGVFNASILPYFFEEAKK